MTALQEVGEEGGHQEAKEGPRWCCGGGHLPGLWRATGGIVYRCLGKEESDKLLFKEVTCPQYFLKLLLACRTWKVQNLWRTTWRLPCSTP